MEQLIECVEALKGVRHALHNDTDPSIGADLDAVIAKFEGCLKEASTDDVTVATAVKEALLVLSSFLSCCSSIADLIARLNS